MAGVGSAAAGAAGISEPASACAFENRPLNANIVDETRVRETSSHSAANSCSTVDTEQLLTSQTPVACHS